MKNKGSISVIIPTYNSVDTIHRAVDSVGRQTLLPKEVIIVDDCSTNRDIEKELKVIKNRFENLFKVVLVFCDRNCGPGTARNIGWEKATGDYIAFLDSDDIWHPQKLEIQYNFMKCNDDIFFSTHKTSIIDEKNKDEYLTKEYLNKELEIVEMNPQRLLFQHNEDRTSCVMLKNTSRYRFTDGKRCSEDYLLWLEILFENKGVVINHKLGMAFKDLYGASGLSGNLWKMEKGELETFSILGEKGHINRLLCTCCKIFSLFKYVRRLMICCFRQN